MNIKSFCYLLLPFFVACQKQSTARVSDLPEPDKAVIENAYPLVTAASSIFPDAGTAYRLGLGQYASFFKFDRSIKNGDLYYEAIQKSATQFSPLKFFISRNGSGEIVAVTSPSEAEVEKFNKAWQR